MRLNHTQKPPVLYASGTVSVRGDCNYRKKTAVTSHSTLLYRALRNNRTIDPPTHQVLPGDSPSSGRPGATFPSPMAPAPWGLQPHPKHSFQGRTER